jgi:hypothetical protein
VLFFDGLVPHGTPVNRTDEFRWAVQFHYRPAAATLVDDATRLANFGSEGRDVAGLHRHGNAIVHLDMTMGVPMATLK